MTFKTLAMAVVMAAVPFAALAADFSENRALDPFTKISAEGRVDVIVNVGAPQKVTVTANKEKFLAGTSTRVRNGTLVIDTEDNNSFFNWLSSYDIKVYITMPALEAVSHDGMGDVDIHGIDSEMLTLSLDGMGDITASGTCGHGDFSINGMGDLSAMKLKCKTVKVEMNGMGDAEVYASELADVTADGMGDVDVYGKPASTKLSKDGMGSVNVHE
jgi:Putative auto-transporter adhesin, head GIN domain